ncbi:hypothetical protein RFI_28777, partial [Reticulomyxa filosa]
MTQSELYHWSVTSDDIYFADNDNDRDILMSVTIDASQDQYVCQSIASHNSNHSSGSSANDASIDLNSYLCRYWVAIQLLNKNGTVLTSSGSSFVVLTICYHDDYICIYVCMFMYGGGGNTDVSYTVYARNDFVKLVDTTVQQTQINPSKNTQQKYVYAVGGDDIFIAKDSNNSSYSWIVVNLSPIVAQNLAVYVSVDRPFADGTQFDEGHQWSGETKNGQLSLMCKFDLNPNLTWTSHTQFYFYITVTVEDNSTSIFTIAVSRPQRF